MATIKFTALGVRENELWILPPFIEILKESIDIKFIKNAKDKPPRNIIGEITLNTLRVSAFKQNISNGSARKDIPNQYFKILAETKYIAGNITNIPISNDRFVFNHAVGILYPNIDILLPACGIKLVNSFTSI